METRRPRRRRRQPLGSPGAGSPGRAALLRRLWQGRGRRPETASRPRLQLHGHFQTEIAFLGIEASPSFVREPEGNGVAERFFRTLKENFLWIHTFDSIEELRTALLAFVPDYNDGWLGARHGYKTPSQIRAEQLSVDQQAATAAPLAA